MRGLTRHLRAGDLLVVNLSATLPAALDARRRASGCTSPPRPRRATAGGAAAAARSVRGLRVEPVRRRRAGRAARAPRRRRAGAARAGLGGRRCAPWRARLALPRLPTWPPTAARSATGAPPSAGRSRTTRRSSRRCRAAPRCRAPGAASPGGWSPSWSRRRRWRRRRAARRGLLARGRRAPLPRALLGPGGDGPARQRHAPRRAGDRRGHDGRAGAGDRCPVGPGGGRGDGWTELVVSPARGVSTVDGILTGWHEPEASHLQLLEAVAGPGALDRSYAAAHARTPLARVRRLQPARRLRAIPLHATGGWNRCPPGYGQPHAEAARERSSCWAP